jgi:hypothetical protein
LGRGAEQNLVEILLMTPDDLAQLLGHGEDHVKVGDRQELLTPLLQPGFRLEAMTRGATAVPAGVVDVVFLPAVIARPQVSAYGLGATVDEVIHGAAVAGQKVLANSRPIVRTVAPEDVRHRWHAAAPTRLEIGHQGLEGGMHDVAGFERAMGVARGGTRALMTEELLDDAP